ncbi:MAG: hypothetical protein IJL05_02965 [Alphaproteobacteria bacterium]|nr:hypothetical protein [Alphaproteobacteria bacterium]
MYNQRGSFLLQALLALTMVFAFIPFFAGKIAARDIAAQMYAATEQVETAYVAARAYVRENKEDLPYKITELSGSKFVNTLEQYGLPLGFVPVTSLRQDLSLIIDKNEDGIISYIKITGGKLSKMQIAELTRRIGFYAQMKNNNTIYVYIPLDTVYSDIVNKKETDENIGFLSELDMDDNNIEKTGVIFARNGEFETVQFGNLSLYGIESGRQEKNKIADLFANKAIFQSADGGAALSLSRGDLRVGDISLRTISKFGNAGSFASNVASVYDFSMAEGRTSFAGPTDWLVRGSVRADNFTFTTERLSIGAYIDASRGQDVYVDPTNLEYNSKAGIDVQTISAANITLRDQTSYGLLNGQSGAVLIDIRPAGTSVLPDVYVDTINNDSFEIIADAKDTTGKNVSCKDIITALGGNYNNKSLAQNIICQYVFWQRLEHRIDIKQCLMNGRDDCI